MAFVNLSLLLGTALVGIPIVLHLVMRQQPRQLLFPAIRFIRTREESNRQTLKLRHWLLLLLRCLVLMIAAWALARPSVSSALFGNWLIIAILALLLLFIVLLITIGWIKRHSRLALAGLLGVGLITLAGLVGMLSSTLGRSDYLQIGDREAPVAAVIIVDSSPRMLYRHENQTRLAKAGEMADWLVRQLPPDSRVAVLDSRAIAPVFSIDLAAARKMIERTSITGAPRSLGNLLETALQMFEQTELTRQEVYLFTDLTTGAWRDEFQTANRTQRLLESNPEVALYLLDVGVDQATNRSLGPVQLASQSLPENAELVVKTSLQSTGVQGRQTVELFVEEHDLSLPSIREGKTITPPARLRSRQEIELAEDATESIEFRVRGLELGTRHGSIRITGSDNLSVDDERFFTVLVKEPALVLVVAPPDVNSSGLVEAIAPYTLRMEQRARYECVVITPDQVSAQRLADFSVVVMLDPTPLASTTWRRLGDYVRQGGQLTLFLGHNAGNPASFNVPEALEILPGRLRRVYRIPDRGVYLAPHNYEHPVMQPFRPIASSVPWARFPVFRHWSLGELAADSHVILRLANQQPALVERSVDQGTVMLMTTPITELERPAGRQAWNELAGPDDWPRFLLITQIMQYLADHQTGRFNYQTGQPVTLANRSDLAPSRYLLFPPQGDPQPIQARQEEITVRTTEAPGTYRLKGNQNGPVVRGFSVNLPASASQLDRLDSQQLDQLLGKDRYQLVRQRDQLQREQGRQRAGREFFPFLVALLALLLIAEHLLSNRFYQTPTPSNA